VRVACLREALQTSATDHLIEDHRNAEGDPACSMVKILGWFEDRQWRLPDAIAMPTDASAWQATG